MKNPRCIKIAALLLALSFIEPRLVFAAEDPSEAAEKAAKDIDKAYEEAQKNIPDKDIKEKEDALDKAARDNDNTQGDPAKDPKKEAQKKEDEARKEADKAEGEDKTGEKYRKALEKRREACKRLKKALDDLRQQLQKRRKLTSDNSDIEQAIKNAEAARKRQEKIPEAPTLSMAVPQGAPSVATLVASGKIKLDSVGTGETIGHVADLKIQNQTDQPINCAVGPMVLESKSGKNQDYVCPKPQTVNIGPHGTATVPMDGVCINRNKPPVAKGAPGDLLVNEGNPTIPQNPNSHIPVNQAGDLLRICTAKYDAANQLQKSGALKNLPYRDPQKQKDIVVQWSTWCDPRISQITGAPPATKDDLKKVVYKQLEAKGPMPPETKKKVDQGIDTIFEKVELTTAKAKDLEEPPQPPVSGRSIIGAPPDKTGVNLLTISVDGQEFDENGKKIKDYPQKAFSGDVEKPCKKQSCPKPQTTKTGKIYCQEIDTCGGKECPTAGCHMLRAWADPNDTKIPKDTKDPEKWRLIDGGVAPKEIPKDKSPDFWAIKPDTGKVYGCGCK